MKLLMHRYAGLALFAAGLLFPAAAFAQGDLVTTAIAPSKANKGDRVWFKVTVTNKR